MMYSLYIILSFWRSGPALQYGVSVTLNYQNVQRCKQCGNLAYKYHMTHKHKALSEMTTRDCTPTFNELNDGELRSIDCRVFH